MNGGVMQIAEGDADRERDLVLGALAHDLRSPLQAILMGIALICAVLFFVNVWRRTWLLPSKRWICILPRSAPAPQRRPL